VYAGEVEEYRAFITPEAVAALKQYLDQRMRMGEEITPTSPILRDAWDYTTSRAKLTKTKNEPEKPHPLTDRGVRSILEKYWKVSGVKVSSRDGGFKTAHSFRKYPGTALSNARLSADDCEVLLGHELPYYKPTLEHIEEEYMKAVPFITVGEEYQLRRELATTEEKHNQAYTGTRLELLELREKTRQQDEGMRKMQSQMAELIALMAERDRRKQE
jgi:hypothetical protein